MTQPMFNPMLLCDFYKLSHRALYPEGTEYVYSTWTPRDSRINGINSVVVFGLQFFLKELHEIFENFFFNVSEGKIVNDYVRTLKYTLGINNPETQHIKDLHRLGYLPLLFKTLSEGSIVPIRTPIMTIQNTDPKFFWLTNYIETFASCSLWQSCTSASIANEYRKLFEKFALKTVGNCDHVDYQGHDFSMRGMSSIQSAITSSVGHLTSFAGSDTIPAIMAIEACYNSNLESEIIAQSVSATEHSIQCSYADDEKYFREMLKKVPTGIISIVCDGYDYWYVVSNILPKLKNEIMNREGKLIVRPDSGDPIQIICGTGETILEEDSYYDICRKRGSIWALANIFGTIVNHLGFKELDSHIGLIYGDAITLERANSILSNLTEQSFASNCVVFGIGSYTYQYNTRDTFGFALKSTLCVINGEEKQINKNPKTDKKGVKKSQKGRVAVFKDENGNYEYKDGYSLNEDIENDKLETVYKNGRLLVQENFKTIRQRIKNGF